MTGRCTHKSAWCISSIRLWLRRPILAGAKRIPHPLRLRVGLQQERAGVTSLTLAAGAAILFEVLMRNMLIVTLMGMMLVATGCRNEQMRDTSRQDASRGDAQKMSAAADECPMCPGVQKAGADGKCPKCMTKVKE
jgi:uncharacterized paraquat-inducible protein A